MYINSKSHHFKTLFFYVSFSSSGRKGNERTQLMNKVIFIVFLAQKCVFWSFL